MNQYRATQLLEGKEIKQDELGLNALVGFATGNWGETNVVKEGTRITLGQVPWQKMAELLLDKSDSSSDSLELKNSPENKKLSEDEK